MGDYEDLFKSTSETNPPIQSSSPQGDTDSTGEDLAVEQKANQKLILLYVGIMFLVSVFSLAYSRIVYPDKQQIIDAIEVVTPLEVQFSPSGNPDVPFQITFSGSLRNNSTNDLPRLWVEYEFYDATGKKVNSYYIDSDKILAGESFTFTEVVDSAEEYTDWEITYGFDEGAFFSVLLRFLEMAICGIAFIVIDKESLKHNWRKFRTNLWGGISHIIIGFLMVFATGYAAQLLLVYGFGVQAGSENEQMIGSMFSNDPIQLAMLFFLLCVFTPLVEELIFRKVLYRFIDRRFGPIVAIISSGLVFGLMHVISFGDFIQAIPYVMMGMVFGYIYHRARKNIIIPIGVHFINNLISFLVYFMMVI